MHLLDVIPFGETQSRKCAQTHGFMSLQSLKDILSASCWEPIDTIVPNFIHVKQYGFEPNQLLTIVQEFESTNRFIVLKEEIHRASFAIKKCSR